MTIFEQKPVSPAALERHQFSQISKLNCQFLKDFSFHS